MKIKNSMIVATFALAAAITAVSCTQMAPNTVHGTFAGLDNDTLFVIYGDGRALHEVIEDSVVVENGKFNFITSKRDNFITLRPASIFRKTSTGGKITQNANDLIFYMAEGDVIKIKAKVNQGHINYAVTGNKIAEDMITVRNATIEQIMAIDDIRFNIFEYVSTHPRWHDEREWKDMKESQNAPQQLIEDVQAEFMRNNPDADISGYYYSTAVYPDLIEGYELLSDRVKNGIFHDQIELIHDGWLKHLESIKNKEGVVAGTKAPGFTLNDIDGNKVSLSDFTGKYIVLDFWGTWCSPCVSGMPHMKQYYDKYKDEVVFIGIANNEKEEKWRSFLQEKGYDWVQLLENKEDKTHVAYGVTIFPTKFLIDKDYNIVDIFTGEREFFYEKLDSLFARK